MPRLLLALLAAFAVSACGGEKDSVPVDADEMTVGDLAPDSSAADAAMEVPDPEPLLEDVTPDLDPTPTPADVADPVPAPPPPPPPPVAPEPTTPEPAPEPETPAEPVPAAETDADGDADAAPADDPAETDGTDADDTDGQ